MTSPIRMRTVAVIVSALSVTLALGVEGQAAQAATTPACDQTSHYRDLNRDGYEDAVVGDPYATVNGHAEAGTVTILYGDSDGRIGEGARRTITRADLGETPAAGDHFGWSVQLNRTLSSGCYGIVIGSPGETVDGKANAGAVHILTFAPVFDADPAADWEINLDQSDVGGTPEAGDQFGYSVAASGGSDEHPVLYAFGAPGENNDSGVVNLTNSDHLNDSGVQVRQGSGSTPGTPQAGDRFGQSVHLGYLALGEEDDESSLVVGVPGDVVAKHDNAGSVMVGRVSRAGIFTGRPISSWKTLTQNTSGVPGVAEAGDGFGSAVALSTTMPGTDDPLLAIGAPGEDIGSKADGGSVTVMKVSGQTLSHRLTLTQNTAGIAGAVESGDQFGYSVAFRDRRALVIGIPGEDIGTVKDAGSAQIIRIGKAHTSTPYAALTESSPGTPGVVQTGSRFGSSVAGLPSTDVIIIHNPPTNYGEAVFAISSVKQDGGSVYVVSDDPTIAPRSWKPGAGGIGGVGARFGQSVG